MSTVAERLRDATIQRAADLCDERFGIGCFALARHVGHVAIAGILGCGIVGYDLDRSGWGGATFLVEAMSACIALKALGAFLLAFENRVATSPVRAVIPGLRVPGFAVVGWAMAAMSLTIACLAAGLAWADASPQAPMAGLRSCGLIALACAASLPIAFLLAQCEHKRLRTTTVEVSCGARSPASA